MVLCLAAPEVVKHRLLSSFNVVGYCLLQSIQHVLILSISHMKGPAISSELQTAAAKTAYTSAAVTNSESGMRSSSV